jgi:hypothetical protein
VVAVRGKGHLAKMILTLPPASGLASGLHRRQEQRHKNADDGNHHQQLNKRETSADADHEAPRLQQNRPLALPG